MDSLLLNNGLSFLSDYFNVYGYYKLLCLYSLAEVSNQMLELYEQNRVPPSQGNEVEGNASTGTRATAKAPAANDEQASKQKMQPTGAENQSNDGSAEMESVITDHKCDIETGDAQKDKHGEVTNRSNRETEPKGEGDQDRLCGTKEGAEVERRGDSASEDSCSIVSRKFEPREGSLGQSAKEAIKMIDKDKVKAAIEKRKKARGEITMKKDVMDDDDLIERELEDGVELAAEDDKKKWERRQNWSEHDNADCGGDYEEIRAEKHMKSQKEMEADNAEGEMTDDASFLSNNRKRKARSSPDGQVVD